MRILISLFFILLFSHQNAASEFGKTLANTPVNHFQLLINNLNVLIVSNFKELFKDEENDDSVEQIYIKFASTSNNDLLVESYYKAPASLVTSKKCLELHDQNIAELRAADELKVALKLLSFYDMSLAEAESIFDNAFMNVHIVAKENSELKKSCSR